MIRRATAATAVGAYDNAKDTHSHEAQHGHEEGHLEPRQGVSSRAAPGTAGRTTPSALEVP